MTQLGRQLRAIPIVLGTFGRKGLIRRAHHELRRKRSSFLAQPSLAPPGAFAPGVVDYGGTSTDWTVVPQSQRADALARARRVMSGEYEAFGHEWRALPRTATEWRTHASGFAYPTGPWWTINHLAPGTDIKDVWEPARFGWMYDLIRGYSLTRDPAYVASAHQLIAEFVRANPAYAGVQWSCGQETAIRALALLHAESALAPSSDDREGSALRLQTLLFWSGERIEDAIEYGLSQRNNHGISEAAGLIHLGLRFRRLHPRGERWLRRGLEFIVEQILDQFAQDGWYAQHSFTYMRLALDQVVLAQRALLADGLTLPRIALDRIAAAVELLECIIESRSGVVPNHGANDGARLVIYGTTQYRDFRPLLTLASLVLRRPLPADVPADPETVRWLGVGAPVVGPPRSNGVRSGCSGWAHARVGDTSVFLRAGKYTHRPSHLDPLHIDVRFGDREIITDAGSFAYNAPPPWRNGLQAGWVHNGPMVNDREHAERGPRFLWYSWPSASLVSTAYENGVATLVAQTSSARRTVEITSDAVTIIDRVVRDVPAVMQVSWLLHPHAASDHVASEGQEVVSAGEASVLGWFSPTYGKREASNVVRIRRSVTDRASELRTVIHRFEGSRPTS